MMKIDSSKKSPLKVTERDQLLLTKLAEYRVLSTEQIRYLCFPSVNRARKRMVHLYRHGLVSRFAPPVQRGDGSSQFLYRITNKGMGLLAGISASRIRVPRGVTASQSDHALRINDVRINLELASRTRDDLAMNFWKFDRDVKITVPVTLNHRLAHVPVIPDANFGLRIQDKDLNYMLEVDRGTAPLTRIRTKLEAYLTLWQSRPLMVQLGVPTFRLLWITASQRRMQNLVNVLQGLATMHPRTDIVVLTTQNQVQLDHPENILGKVWHITANSEVLPASPFPVIPFERSRLHQVNHLCANQKPELAKGDHGPGG
ncbi:MAG: replication-relaxation family protein [Candidatus Zixiibacteriota bacterium]